MLVLVCYLRLSGSREFFIVLTSLVVPRDGVLGSSRGRVIYMFLIYNDARSNEPKITHPRFNNLL
jgi:hypothetical protein